MPEDLTKEMLMAKAKEGMPEDAWQSYVPVANVPRVFVERDFAGMGGHLRYTLYPEGATCLQDPFYVQGYKLTEWKQKRDSFFKQVPPDTLILTVSRRRIGIALDVIGFDGFER